jgi:DNA-binding NtrC family response regulator
MPSQDTVLMVEDEAAVREALAEALRLEGYQVLITATVPEAEDMLKRLGRGAIQLVIANIHLTPDLEAREGYMLAQRWRVQYPCLPFLLISGDSRNQDLPDIRAGLVRLLVKPFAIDALLTAIREALGQTDSTERPRRGNTD